jgi:hypothetical protein
MGEYAPQQTPSDYEALAEKIDDNFRFFAERVPSEVKLGQIGATQELHRVQGLGHIEATYLGKTAAGTNPHDNFNVRVRVQAEDGRFGFYKDYALTHQSAPDFGPVIDKQPTTADDLFGGPISPEEIADTINALTRHYTQLRPL